MNLTDKTIDQAQYLLDHGHATQEDAEEFARVWNETKIYTVCRVVVKRKYHKWGQCSLMTPILVLTPVDHGD